MIKIVKDTNLDRAINRLRDDIRDEYLPNIPDLIYNIKLKEIEFNINEKFLEFVFDVTIIK